MKKTITLALCACFVCMFIMKADALPKRVGYYGTQILGQDYTSLQAAHDASSAGDTLLIFPGSWSANFSKRLVVIGYGYFLRDSGANANLQAINKPVSITIQVYSNAKASNFEGLDNFTLRIVDNNVDSIKIRRCLTTVQLYSVTLSNLQITQSYIRGVNSAGGDWYYYYPVFKQLLVQNCFIQSLGAYNIFPPGTTQTGTFNNNVFGTGTLNFLSGDFLLRNNIFLGTSSLVNKENLEYKNNIASNGIIPFGNGNKPNVDIAKVCIGYPVAGNYSFDERFKIKPNGPAAGAGENGEDCGMYGGDNPYKLSGIPPIPAFYKLTAPSTKADSNPYTITFSVRSNN